jgi:UPF0271 protein
MRSIDLNCDLGEGAAHDEALMALITSANIACGGHAGDHGTMREAVKLARFYGVAVGAHPGYADREHFGRRELSLTSTEIVEMVRGQIEAMQSIASKLGVSMTHVKPHGALYTQAAKNVEIADAVVAAIRAVDEKLRLYALSGSELILAGQVGGLSVANEVFVDRAYRGDGSLTSRDEPGALIEDVATGVSQATSMLCDGVVPTIEGTWLPLMADTICVHGDGEHAVDYARELRAALTRAGVEILPYAG